MGLFSSSDPERDRLAEELAGLKGKIADLQAEVAAMEKRRDSTAERNKHLDEIEKLRREKARLIEDNDRKIRETEHKVGLLKVKQDHEVANARREAELDVKEANLTAERERHAKEVKFQREHMQREVDRFDGIAKALMERLPVIEVDLGGQARTSGRRGQGNDVD
jgi:hypothetical protein